MSCSRPSSSVRGSPPGKNTGVGLPFSSPSFPQPGMNPGLLHEQLPSEPPRKANYKGPSSRFCIQLQEKPEKHDVDRLCSLPTREKPYHDNEGQHREEIKPLFF